jgi:beta-phosphoglucomutase-like phosphatase (HAD superfamily)
VFDHGTLVDSVDQHVLAWQEALEVCGIQLSVWRIHRRIGRSGGLFVGALLHETGRQVDAASLTRIQPAHTEAYRRRADGVRLLPGAQELLQHLSNLQVPWAVATSSVMEAARPTLEVERRDSNLLLIERPAASH